MPSLFSSIRFLRFIGVSVFFLFLIGCGQRSSSDQQPSTNASSTALSSAGSSEISSDYEVQEVTGGLIVPWSLAFTSSGRLLVTERLGTVRVIQNGELQSQPLHTFAEVSAHTEEGLMGMTVDPDYAHNHQLYFSLAEPNGSAYRVKVVSLRDDGDRLSDEHVLLQGIPAALFHAGSRIKFGPDGKLYITSGDATNGKNAQDRTSFAGKILRINSDGTIPADNPFPGSPVWSFGHRNPQGIAWDTRNGTMLETEHGPTAGFDGAAGGDEVNRILPGKNYGWPLVSHDQTLSGTVAPLITFTPAEAPSGTVFYDAGRLPEFQNHLLFAALKGEGIWDLSLSTSNPPQVLSKQKLFGGSYGRIRDVIQGPDGFLYFATSNRDGRGTRREGDDHVYRIVPR